ncbi:Histone-lysine N-methyltransferase SETMAR like protein [Argiope bruennichi]|uniref:Histone-lysine N-methyltransferase SETMAR like protein n=1 Tax=Argiope bruennichi TaxID=94029 RepID=A0A8T0EB80_ARGBR|nr:Histone-lysine N-methyltransferase SETMAR like protein [Argiope bruennichi]
MLLPRIQRVHSQLYRTSKWSLLHDNPGSLTAIHVCNFLSKRRVTVLAHPPYSPDLAPADFFLFPHLKGILKGTHFVDNQTSDDV